MKILVLAGGSDQIALIEELKKRSNEIILVDYFDNPPAKRYAHKHIIASTLDVDKVKDIALCENVDMITTACTDQALLTVAKVSEDLGLPCYITYQTALNVTNKSYMKKVMFDKNIPTAKYKILSSVSQISELDEFEYPLVVKPVDCNSSKGVKLVVNNQELELYLKQALNFSRTKTAIVEEFKEGQELSVDCFIENGRAKLLSVTTSRKKLGTNSFTIIQSYYPVVSTEEEVKLEIIAQNIADAFDLKNTPLLIQLIYNKQGFFVLEFSARMGGGSKYKLIEILSGVNIMEQYVNLILSKKIEISPRKRSGYVTINYVYSNPGKFSKLRGFDELEKEGIIESYFLYKTENMVIDKAETSSDRVAGYVVCADTELEMVNKINYIDSCVAVLDPLGKDIMIHNLI